MTPVTGADSLVEALTGCGLTTCFTNPGTSELHLVASLSSHPGMRTILCLFEGVAAGAADGYARMMDRPAAVLVHLGVGLSNASACLHNARRAMTPVLALVGDHAGYHRHLDAPLTSDIEGLALPVSDWVSRAGSARSVGADAARAYGAAVAPPGGVATLIVPADVAWSSPGRSAPPAAVAAPCLAECSVIEAVAEALRAPRRSALLLSGKALRSEGLRWAGRIAAATGVRLLCEPFPARLRRGAGEVEVEKLAYFPEQAAEQLRDVEQLILVGARTPVPFFAYPGRSSELTAPGCLVLSLTLEHEEHIDALTRLADALNAPRAPAGVVGSVGSSASRASTAGSRMNHHGIGAAIARHLPAEAIVVDEALTSSTGPFRATINSAPHDYLALTGGAIGHGMPMAAGAAVACPDRKVVCLTGDGGALYTIQALWTMARERLDVTVVVFNNAAYSILRVEFDRLGLASADPVAASLTSLDDPRVNWPSLAAGFGVDAQRVDSVDEFESAFATAMATQGPVLLEAVL